MRLYISSLAAITVQPIVFFISIAPKYFTSSTPLHGMDLVLLVLVLVATAAVLMLGLPTFLLLRKYGRLNWTSLAITGFCLGVLPVAPFWPRRLAGYSAGQNWHGSYVDTYIDGLPTLYAWLAYAESVLSFGMHGLIGALVFYAVWRRLGATEEESPEDRRTRMRELGCHEGRTQADDADAVLRTKV